MLAFPTSSQIGPWMRYSSEPLLRSLYVPAQRFMRFFTMFSQMRCMKSYGNDSGKESDERALRTGIPLIPYFFARRLDSAPDGAYCTSWACTMNSSCKHFGSAAGL